MALNMSRQMYSGRFVVDGSADRGGDGYGRTRQWSREVEDGCEYYNDSGCREAGNDILEILPADPFGMDISTTFTAITGWLENLDYNGHGSNNAGSDTGEYTLFTGFNFVWNSSFWIDSLPMNFEVDEASFIDGRVGGGTLEQGSSRSVCCDGALLVNFGVDEASFIDGGNSGGTAEQESSSSACCGSALPMNFGVDEASFIDGRVGGDTKEQGPSGSASCNGVAADSSVDDILHKLPADDVFHQTLDDQSVSGACADGHYDPDRPFFLVLGYLGVRDLLATEAVCRTLHSYLKTDPLPWLNIHIDQPLNEKINDDVLIQLTSRAQGNLQSLSLVDCSRITDGGLKRVLETNPHLTKLSVPGCTRLSIEGIVNNLKEFSSSSTSRLKCLRIGGVYGVTEKHYDELKSLLAYGNSLQQDLPKPHFYGRDSYYLPSDDDRPIDVEACPICQNLRLVYDCPNVNCQGSAASQTCRACVVCIRRCIQCGQCINDCVYHENFCLEYLCIDCWNQLPVLYQSVSSDMPTGS